ncbi:hypothetical protein [Ruminococcus flavefaciens]|uniref:hypothetical protein n=1 Tax=Ruminococcus flavefaciens TaxID=1265 RepID=UPI00048EB976|nr:hypothetical protein [Ruminococcus flavefaciens]
MTDNSTALAALRQNLADAGMDSSTIEKCVVLIDKRDSAALGRLIGEYRQQLLDTVHSYNRRIDCLDYFTYTLDKNGGIQI